MGSPRYFWAKPPWRKCSASRCRRNGQPRKGGPMRDVIVSAIVLMCVALPATVVADTIKIGGTGSSMQLMRALGDAFHKSRPDVEVAIVSGLGSRGGKK